MSWEGNVRRNFISFLSRTRATKGANQSFVMTTGILFHRVSSLILDWNDMIDFVTFLRTSGLARPRNVLHSSTSPAPDNKNHAMYAAVCEDEHFYTRKR
jgi:hypothetical protein